MRGNSKPIRTKLNIALHTESYKNDPFLLFYVIILVFLLAVKTSKEHSCSKTPASLRIELANFKGKGAAACYSHFPFPWVKRNHLRIARALPLSPNFSQVATREVFQGADTISHRHLALQIQCALSKCAGGPRLERESCQDAGGFCHSERYPEAGRMGCQKLHRRRPAIGKEQTRNRCPGSKVS